MAIGASEAGLKGICPRCGQGRLFKGFLAFADECPVCGLDFRIEDAGDGPAVFVIFLTAGLLIPLSLFAHFRLGWSMTVTVLGFSVIITLASLALLRPLRGLMLAQQIKRNALEATSRDVE